MKVDTVNSVLSNRRLARTNCSRVNRSVVASILLIVVSMYWSLTSHAQSQIACPTPSFSAATNIAAGLWPSAIIVADFNRDGKLDLVVAVRGETTNEVGVFLGDGQGGFGQRTYFPVGLSPRKIAVGDFNCDGKPDIVTPNTTSNNVSILLNTCGR
ncbi:MAG: VCBS repeat-containing protein [Acidobacteria bacterium]|nr:VCBS repeat-containing protein [Acidobacteriota bacterium]